MNENEAQNADQNASGVDMDEEYMQRIIQELPQPASLGGFRTAPIEFEKVPAYCMRHPCTRVYGHKSYPPKACVLHATIMHMFALFFEKIQRR